MAGSTIGGRYRLIDQLGVGGFSQTFLAEDLHLPGHPTCVVKQLKPLVTDERHLQTARRLFETEAKVLYQLGDHDQIPRLLAHFMDGEEFYLVQELIKGVPLTKKLASGFPWSEKRVMELLSDLMTVLDFVHGQNVIHRDIKPSNLIYRTDGKIVLIDFGAVKQVGQQQADSKTGQTQTVSVGTQGYMPAEQLGGHPRFCSDIYAAGMVGIQALTGTHPKQISRHPHTGEIDWRNHQVNGRKLPALRVSSGLSIILDRMVCYHFKDRYQTAAEVLQDLSALLAQQPAHSEDELIASDTVIWRPPAESLGEQIDSIESINPVNRVHPMSPMDPGNPIDLSAPIDQTAIDITELEGTDFLEDQPISPIALESSFPDGDEPSEPCITDLFQKSDSPSETFPPEHSSPEVISEAIDFEIDSPSVPLSQLSQENSTQIETIEAAAVEKAEAEGAIDPDKAAVDKAAVDKAAVDKAATDNAHPSGIDRSAPGETTLVEPETSQQELQEPIAAPAAELISESDSDPEASDLHPAKVPSVFPPVPFLKERFPSAGTVPPTVMINAASPAPTPTEGATPSEPTTGTGSSHAPVSSPQTSIPTLRPLEDFSPTRASWIVWILVIGISALGIGLVSLLTIALLSSLSDLEPRPSGTVESLPEARLLPCDEPPIPTELPETPDFVFPDGTEYFGEMVGNRPADGRGTMLFPTGNRYDGEFRDGQRNGCGTQTNANGRQYIGEFQSDQFHGQGIWVLENGDRYIGTFQANRCHGEGVFLSADGRVQRGIWQNGNLIDGDLSCTPSQ